MTRQPWERLPEETAPAWEAFQTYRDMGLTRSVTRVAQQLNKSRTLIGRWSSEHRWVIRASAWDSEQDRLHQLEMRVQRRKSAERNIKIANVAMTVASKSLVEHAKSDAVLSPQDISRLIDTSSKLERLTLGEAATEHLAIAARGYGTGTDTAVVASLTDEERRDRMFALRRELNSRLGDFDPDVSA